VWFDHDDDGDLDVIVGNMDGDANGLFSNSGGRFVDVAQTAGVAWGGRTPNDKSNGTVRPCVADVNDDGRLDLFFANYGKNGLFLNQGKGRFEDVSAAWGIDLDARYDSCAFADMDNDGDLDLYVNGTVTGGKQYPDYLFRNTGTRFEDVTPAEIGSPNGDHGVQWADFDLDGHMDLALTGVEKTGMHWLLRNTMAASGSTRAINLRVLDAAGRSTLAGTALTIEAAANRDASRRTTRLVDGGSGYNTQNDAPLHVVVPDAANVTLTVTVRTPGGMASTSQQQLDLTGWPRRVYEHRLPARQGERIVPVHQEPRHHLVFDSPGTRILDVQIPPGDTTLFHTHSDPILYVTMSTSRTRSQNLGADWSGAPSAPGAPGAPAAPVLPSVPPGRMMSTTSYAERPQTHRVNNIGQTLFRLIGITNSSAGDERTDPSEGFDTEPEISNRWFRGYRRTLTAQDSSEHRHANPVAIVLVSGAASVRTTSASEIQRLAQPGAFVFLEAGARHVLRAEAAGTQVVEVEVRRPR
jgi:quercetin dioxygenase-like cupin family protein